MEIRNVGILTQHSTASQLRRPQLEDSNRLMEGTIYDVQRVLYIAESVRKLCTVLPRTHWDMLRSRQNSINNNEGRR
jgi:hypothetical protein